MIPPLAEDEDDVFVAEGGRLMLTTAGSINRGTPYANLRALCRAAEQCGRY